MSKKNSSHLTLEEIVFNTIHHSDLSINEIAANTGTGYNHLTRMASITDECNMPLSKAVPVMNVTGDYNILHYMAKQTNHLAIPMPRGIRKGTDPKMDISQYGEEFHQLMSKLMKFVNEPTEELLTEIDELMRKHIGDSENIRRRAQKHQLHQTEMKL